MTETQIALLLQVSAAGWSIKEVRMIGRKVWLTLEKNRKNTNGLTDESMWGSIGVKGTVEFEYSQFTYHEKVTELYQFRNRLGKPLEAKYL